jgi:SNF2 family DNA or RNA helicase
VPWGTLIVCPLSLLSQWESELVTRIDANYRPTVYIYHGAKRTKSPHELAKYDVVLTTYAILAKEYPKSKDHLPHAG